jgi:hypothetical protein
MSHATDGEQPPIVAIFEAENGLKAVLETHESLGHEF